MNKEELTTLAPLIAELEKRLLAESADIAECRAEVGTEARLARFLVSKQCDLARAKAAIEDHLKWRKENNVEHWRALMQDKPLLAGSFPHAAYLHARGLGMTHTALSAGKSRTGELLNVEILGGEGQSADISDDDANLVQKLTEYYIAFFEKRGLVLEEWTKEQQRLVRTVQIRDVSRLSFMPSAGAFSVLRTIMGIGMSNYPECASTVFFVNPPSMFSAIYSVVKRWLPEQVDRKFRFVTKQEIASQILKAVRPCQIIAWQDLLANKNGDEICQRITEDGPYSTPAEERLEILVSARDVHDRFYELHERGVRAVRWKRLNTEESPNSVISAKVYYIDPATQHLHLDAVKVVEIPVSPDQTQAVLPEVEGVKEALLCLTLDHTSAWLQSHTFKLIVETTI